MNQNPTEGQQVQAERDEFFMQAALREAQAALAEDEVPIGAVVVAGGRIIGKGHNQVERLNDPTAHAEMIAITAACNYLGAKYLTDCTLYVTVEPCPMCAGALRWAQLGRVVYGTAEEKFGFTTLNAPLLHPRTKVSRDVLAPESRELMQVFFQSKRRKS